MDDAITRLKASLEGRYEVLDEIGQGGMAVVFLAEDLKHHRKVALKVLRSELAAILGGGRFLKEIEVTANLQHPNILPLYDSGEADGFLYYVMPLVEGETLREKLDREHQLQTEEAVEIARSVAAALDYAHRHDVIHRDIKPSNILLHDGQALVADFGIALAMSKAGKETRLTETGLSVGTPHYMSPEQAAGDRELDARSDLYSLGAMTFEMLVGEPPHVAKTAQAVVAKILTDTPPPIRRTRELVPANVEAAVAKALARSPADRFTSAAEFAAALTNPGFTLPSLVAGVGAAESGRWRRLAMGFGAVAVVLAGLAVRGWVRPEEAPGVARYGLAFPPGEEPMDLPAQSFDVAGGGAAIVYVGPGEEGGQLWVKRRDRAAATPLPGTSGAISPSISPDASEVVFVAGGQLRKVPLSGGAPITLADSVRADQASWTDNGRIVFAGAGWRLRHLPAAGGAPEDLWPTQPSSRPAFAPASIGDSNSFLFSFCEGNCANVLEVWVFDGRAGEARQLIPGAARAWYLNPDRVVFVRPDGAVFVAPFDSGSLAITGPAIPILEGVKVQGYSYPEMAVAADGTLLMVEGPGAASGPAQEVIWVTRDGAVSPVDPGWLINNARNFGWALSPDGTRLAIGLNTEEGDDIWIKDIDGGTLDRLTYDPAEDCRPRWSSDGQFVFFSSRRRDGVEADLWMRRADGATEAEPVLLREPQIWDTDATPDGEWIVARVGGVRSGTGLRNIIAYHMEGDTAEVPILTSDYDEVSPRISPDGRWLAYASMETGEWEIFVRPFPDVASGRTLVSRGGGTAPLWARGGRELFYESPDGQMMVASFDTVEGFRVLQREVLFELPPGVPLSPLTTGYDVSPDDQRFIMVRAVQNQTSEGGFQLILVENWLEEIKGRMREQGR